MSRATSRRRGTRSCARGGRSSGATDRASWSDRPASPAKPISSSRTSATAASWRRPRPMASPTRLAPTASAWSRPTTTTTGSSTSSWRTTRTPTSSIATSGTADSRASGSLAGVAVNGDGRAQAGMGADAGDYDGDGRMDLVLTAFAHDRNTLYRNVDGRQFEDASVTAGLAGPTFVRMGWGTAFVDADLDGKLDLFFANGHIFADIETFPALEETYRQKNQLLLNLGTRFHDVSDGAGSGLQIARVGRGLAVGDLDDDGDPDLVVSNMDDAPTLLENTQRTGHHWIGVPRRLAHGQPVRDRREGDDRGRDEQAGARDPLGRQLSVAERSARVLRPGRVRRSGDRGGPHAGWETLAMARTRRRCCTCSIGPARQLDCELGAAGVNRDRPRARPAGGCVARDAARRTDPFTARSSRSPRPWSRFSKTSNRAATRFPLERQASELEARLRELGNALRTDPRASGARRRTGCSHRTFAARACARRRHAGDRRRRVRGETSDDAADRALARRARVRRGAPAPGRRSAAGDRRRIPGHGHRRRRRHRNSSAPTSATTSSEPARRRGVSSTSASGE